MTPLEDSPPITAPPAGRRVALVHDWLTGMRGGEKVLAEIARLYPEAPIYTLFHFPGSVSQQLESHPIHTTFLQRMPAIRERYRNYLPIFPLAISTLDLSDYDLVVSTSHCVAKSVAVAPGALHVCYCHTPMRYAWDQRHEYFRDRGPIAWVRALILAMLRRWDARTSDRVHVWLANSNFVRKRIHDYYGREATVLAPPVDTEFFDLADPGSTIVPSTGNSAASPAGSNEAPYALTVAALAPYKRLDLAITACTEAGLGLRMVGSGSELDSLRDQATSTTRFLGRVSDLELRDLYRGALCLIQPGVEDFGISPVEALACGCPVVARGEGGVLDIVEDGVHGILYGPDYPTKDLSEAIDKVRKMQFNRLNLRRRAEFFSTVTFENRLKRILQETLQPAEEHTA